MRGRVEKQIAKKQKEEKEDRLRDLALQARANRAGIYTADKADEESAERDQIRQERHKERQRESALSRASGGKKYKSNKLSLLFLHLLLFYLRGRPKERDISEQIALGVQSASSSGVQYDQRLFNMSSVR